MNLAIDIGNTRAKLGVFNNNKLITRTVLTHYSFEDILAFATNQTVKNVIYSTVRESMDSFVKAQFQEQFYFLELDASTPIPIQNAYTTPHTLGKDRLASVVGAYTLFPDENCVVIDAGTCIKSEFLSKEGVYWGGNISPGINMRLKAMHEFTAKLPLIEQGEIKGLLGDATETALRNGGQLGALLEIDAFINRCEQQFGKINVILTGGDAGFFAKNLKKEIFVNQNLVLEGLNKILTYNVNHKA